MIDGYTSTVSWQRHPGDIAVLPIGSFEQHGAHLPLFTDVIEAEYFGKMIAEQLDAALLPVLPYANCLEHSGFRGTMTLRPETLMQVLRDIVDELERQHFHILIVLNGHGGNYSLFPAIRDINRLNRPIKIIPVNFWEYADPFKGDSDSLRPEIHAGEWETSLMLAIRPDLVKGTTPPMPTEAHDPRRLQQRDLNTFGVGHFNPHGAVGYPAFATAEKGKAVIDSIRRHMPIWVRDRIERIRQNPRYSGGGGIVVRLLTPADIPEAMRLKNLAGWNQTESDWRFFIEFCPQGCFAAVHNGAIIGTATALAYENQLAWIGLVLVDPAFRRLGIGRLLMETAIESARQSVRVIKLDATPDGKKLYDKLGFVDECLIHRMVCRACPTLPVPSQTVEAINRETLAEIAPVDTGWFGVNRAPVLRALRENSPDVAWCLRRQGRIVGYCLGRKGMNFHHIGPLMAENESDAMALLSAAAQSLAGQAVVLDVMAAHSGFLSTLTKTGFTSQRTLMRMTLGENLYPGQPKHCFAIAGPELG